MNSLVKILPPQYLVNLSYIRNRVFLYLPHQSIKLDIRRSQKARVAFVVMNISMWKNTRLYQLLKADERFDPVIVLSPSIMLERRQQEIDLLQMREYFTTNRIPYIDFDFDSPYDLRKRFAPHIIFYQQSYGNVHCPQHDSVSFMDRLICYVPYSFWPTNERHGFDLSFHRNAWRIYYPNESIYLFAKENSINHARNARISGYPSADMFMDDVVNNPWKHQHSDLKKIIWAPHFTINQRQWFGLSSFLMLSDYMVDFAQENVNRIQMAFKPHPRLLTELYRHPEWGGGDVQIIIINYGLTCQILN